MKKVTWKWCMIRECNLFRAQVNGYFDILFLTFLSGMPAAPGVNMKDLFRINFHTPLALRKDRIDLYDFDADAIWRAVHRKIQMMSCFDENPVELEKPLPDLNRLIFSLIPLFLLSSDRNQNYYFFLYGTTLLLKVLPVFLR